MAGVATAEKTTRLEPDVVDFVVESPVEAGVVVELDVAVDTGVVVEETVGVDVVSVEVIVVGVVDVEVSVVDDIVEFSDVEVEVDTDKLSLFAPPSLGLTKAHADLHSPRSTTKAKIEKIPSLMSTDSRF